MKKPEKKETKVCDSNCRNYNTMLEHGCSCEETSDNVGYNEACDKYIAYFKYLLSKIPSDEQMLRSPSPDYATAFYQGQYDLLMNLLGKEGLKK